MSNCNAINMRNPELGSADILTTLIRKLAREMIICAVEAEMQEFINQHSGLLTSDGKKRVVRNGYLPDRQVTTGIGPVDVRIPRVRDREQDQKEKINFDSKIVPKHLRRSASIEELLPLLYLKGISTNDFQSTLEPILGKQAKNISAGVVSKLKTSWEAEYNNWTKSSLADKKDAYWWADGIYLQARMEESKNCVLVIIGATEDGTKELVGFSVGYRESKDSWKGLLIELQSRGLETGPLLSIGDGGLGFWGAISELYPNSKHQRCWVHKTSNILNKLPKSMHSQAKKGLQEIYMSETKDTALKMCDKFIKKYQDKYPKVSECLAKDIDSLLSFYDFPAVNWQHIRTTNPIESTFATVRHRTYKAKGCFSQNTILTMVFKLCIGAESRWKRLYGHRDLQAFMNGVEFKDGVRVNTTLDTEVGRVA